MERIYASLCSLQHYLQQGSHRSNPSNPKDEWIKKLWCRGSGTLVKTEAQVNMAHLLAQPQQKLQLDYKTRITQNCQKIELYGSPITKGLKKPHLSMRVGGAEGRDVWRGRTGGPTPMCMVEKSGRKAQEQGILPPHQTAQSRVPMPGR